jgi:NCAIR mutase (PurE)-related protein
VPEVIYAEHKAVDDVRAALARQAELTGRALASRCPPATLAALPPLFQDDFEVTVHVVARAVVVARHDAAVEPSGGRIAIIAAGTSDRPVAAEAALMAREMGVDVEEITDVGVAGLHRLVTPLERVMDAGVDAIVVAAGMDGALPSVIAGLVPVPVIGLPTSVGYGFGGQGVGALTAMLQSCAPGLMVVNIDNGIGAGASAALIANRAALARSGARSSVAVP